VLVIFTLNAQYLLHNLIFGCSQGVKLYVNFLNFALSSSQFSLENLLRDQLSCHCFLVSRLITGQRPNLISQIIRLQQQTFFLPIYALLLLLLSILIPLDTALLIVVNLNLDLKPF
jgi:hypothetical protein